MFSGWLPVRLEVGAGRDSARRSSCSSGLLKDAWSPGAAHARGEDCPRGGGAVGVLSARGVERAPPSRIRTFEECFYGTMTSCEVAAENGVNEAVRPNRSVAVTV